MLIEVMLMNMESDDPKKRELKEVLDHTGKITTILSKMKHIRQYTTTPYPGGTRILDFEAASREKEED